MVRTIAILPFDDVEELDAIGPFEVLAGWTRMFPDDGGGPRQSARTVPSPFAAPTASSTLRGAWP